jgi:arsenate reductase
MKEKLKILFLCTGNSCRSQMAEGWAKKLKEDIMDVYSAGVETHGLNPHAVKVMAEAGVDISHHRSKPVDEFKDTELDAVITVCGHAHETCPYFPPRCKVIHVGFDDPPKLAEALEKKGESKEKQLDCFRKVRDEIKAFVEKMPENIFTE